MMWWNQYVGIPFLERGRSKQGVDCWGLVSLILHEIFAVNVPDLLDEYQSCADLKGNNELYSRPSWRDEWQQVDKPELGAVVAFRINGFEGAHVGLCLQDNYFIHAWNGGNTTIESLNSPIWSKRIVDYWKHKGGAACPK